MMMNDKKIKDEQMTDEEYIVQGANKVKLIKLGFTVAAILIMIALCIKFWNADGNYQVELDADKLDGYQWTYTIEEDGIVKELQKYYVDGMYVFVFEGVSEGTVDIEFCKTKDDNKSKVLETQVYSLRVNPDMRIVLTGITKS